MEDSGHIATCTTCISTVLSLSHRSVGRSECKVATTASPLFAADLVLSVARAERLASFLNDRKDKVVDLTNVAHGVLDAIDNGGRQEDDSDIVLRIMHQG